MSEERNARNLAAEALVFSVGRRFYRRQEQVAITFHTASSP